ncbi:MAG: tyrosine recombinase XerC [Myxococcota bacterium]
MSLDEDVDDFLLHLRVERNLSDRTLDAYARDLASFTRFVDDRGSTLATEVTPDEVSGWVRQLAAEGRAATTQARMLVAVRGFYRYLRRERGLESLPTEAVDLPKTTRKLPRLVDRDGALALLAACGDNLRDRLFVLLLYGVGLRVSEVVDLDIQSLHLDAGALRVVGKGAKERAVPVGPVVVEALRDYLEHGRSSPGDALFPGRSRSGRVSRQTIFLRLRRLSLAAGLPAGVSPHKLRHGFATDLLRGGADLRSVQALLGHADLRTTEIYTQVDDKHVQRVYRRTHPRR